MFCICKSFILLHKAYSDASQRTGSRSAAIDAGEAEKYIVNKMLTEPGTFTKQEPEKARILREGNILYTRNNESISDLLNAQRREVPKSPAAENASGIIVNRETDSVKQNQQRTKTLSDRDVLSGKLSRVESKMLAFFWAALLYSVFTTSSVCILRWLGINSKNIK